MPGPSVTPGAVACKAGKTLLGAYADYPGLTVLPEKFLFGGCRREAKTRQIDVNLRGTSGAMGEGGERSPTQRRRLRQFYFSPE